MRLSSRSLVHLLAGMCAFFPGVAGAQELAGLQSLALVDSVPQRPPEDSVPVIRWWHGLIAAGGVGALMLVDEPVQRYAVEHGGTGADNVASVIRHFGQADVYVPVTAGIVAAGLLTHQPEVTRAGGRVALALVLTAGITGGAKITIGRARPNESTDAFDFQPFSGQESMPSGHTSMAFAFATALSDEIHRPVATVGLYGLATGVGWSRIHDNEHWLSDVGAGAILGITCAKLANGHWRIFHLHPPTILVTPQSAGLGWHAAF